MEKVVIGNDSHHPFHDQRTCDMFVDFIAEEQPNMVVLNGDMLDCYNISSFNKDPLTKETLQEEVDSCYWFLHSIREAAGKDCKIVYIEGNHENRMQRFLWGKAPQLWSLDCLKIEGLLWLDELDIQYRQSIDIGKFHIYHGSLVRQDAGYTAKAEYLKNGQSGITGHTHRDAKFTKRTRGGHYVWYENFCMCDLDAEYINGVANWTQGWSMLTTVGSRQYVDQIPVINHRYIWKGEEIKS